MQDAKNRFGWACLLRLGSFDGFLSSTVRVWPYLALSQGATVQRPAHRRAPAPAYEGWHGACLQDRHAHSTETPARILMKDLMFIVVTGAVFALAWLYTKSLDHL